MANKNSEHVPLSFWATVGANITGGLITGLIGAGLSLVAAVIMARSMSANVLEGLRQDGVLPPRADQEPGEG